VSLVSTFLDGSYVLPVFTMFVTVKVNVPPPLTLPELSVTLPVASVTPLTFPVQAPDHAP